MGRGYQQDVAGEQRALIEKCDCVLVSPYNFRWRLAGDDIAEYAGHGISRR
jgi:hypothetical protein